ncbi:hypothetical protein SteCoe_36382 [Stentor coeruleus]|uniref:Uncharacterized protein n=1 Tax=Stentor coeruleus TaxID=5963 RepID=A0A1R2AQK8_9CILI|nr:hypothetical protein SteCoe_36382 [Stentor coeruleus]
MGCCNASEKVVSSQLKEGLDLDQLDSEKALEEITERVIKALKDFEQKVLKRITPEKPRGTIEFEQIIRYSLQETYKNFEAQFLQEPKSQEIKVEYKKYRLYLLSKCKSKEAYFRYLNDCYSFEQNLSLKNLIVNRFCSKQIDYIQAIETYQKMARGTYTIEGLEDVHEMLQLEDKESMLKKIEIKSEEIKKGLEENRIQLERIECKPLLPINAEYNDDLCLLSIDEEPARMVSAMSDTESPALYEHYDKNSLRAELISNESQNDLLFTLKPQKITASFSHKSLLNA